MNSRQRVEASLRQMEREHALLQHHSTENQRKVEIETDRKRGLENECEQLYFTGTERHSVCSTAPFETYDVRWNLLLHRSRISVISTLVNNLKDQFEDLKKKNHNSQISSEKNIQLQKQVRERGLRVMSESVHRWAFSKNMRLNILLLQHAPQQENNLTFLCVNLKKNNWIYSKQG